MTSKRFIVKNGLDNNSQTIINVSDPVNAQDAATKNFSSNANNITSGILAIAYGGTGVSAFTANGALYVTSSNTLTSGTLPILSGGTSANTATGAFNALAPSQTGNSGKYLTTDGTNTSWGTVSGSGGTSTASVITATSTNSSFYPTFVSATTGNNALSVNSSLTYNPSTATLTTTNIVATTFSGSGASLTNLPAGTLTGTVPSAVLGNTTIYVGTTAVTLNRASSNLGLTGITSIAMPGATSGTITLTPAATAGTTAITVPATAGTLVTTGDTGTVTNTMLAGSISNAKLANSAVTVGTTAISLGSSSTTLAGLTSVSSTSFTGALTGNADTATKWATARTLAGNSVDGSANVAFSNKFVVQGTTDAGLSGAQFLGALGTGIVKNTTTTGVLSIAVAGDFPTLNQNTTGYATSLAGGNATTLLGSVPYQSAVNTTTLLAPNTTTTKKFFTQTGDGTNGAAPAWNTIAAGDVPTLNQNTTGSAATLTTSRNINGVAFNGSADITVTAAAGTLTGTTLNATVVTSSLTSVGTVTSGTWSGLFGAVSGANLTNITAANLIGTLPSAVLGNTTIYVGTTAVTLNRASSNLGLTGITSLAMPGATSGTITLTPAATAGTTAITVPATAGTLVTTGDTGTVTNTMLAGSIANAKLANSAVTVGTTAISLGSSSTTLAGLTSVSSTAFTGALTGAASSNVLKAGDTMTGELILSGDPVNALGAATKQYVDNGIAGLSWKTAVAAATTANITLSGLQTIDGYTTLASDRILVKNQTTTADNGIYVASASTWTRATDANTAAELNAAAVYVQSGTTLADTGWVQTTIIVTVGTTAVTWSQFSGSGAYAAGTGLSLVGNTFSNSGVLSVTGTTNQITTSASTGAITLSLPQNINSGAAPTFVGTNFTSIPNSAFANSAITIGTTAISLGSANTTLAGLTSVTSTSFVGALTGNASTATSAATLTTARTINGTSFNGSADITVTAAAGTLTGTTLNATVVNSSLTSVGTITSGTWSGSFGAVSGANLTGITAGNLSGTIPSAVLGNSTHYIGTTAVTLNRASANLGLTGITSVAMPGATSGTITLTPAATAGTTAITIPATAGTLVTTGDTGTVTNAMLAGSISNANLANSSVTVNGTAISLGSSGTVTAAAGTLTGTTLNATVVTSSLTSVGTLSSLSVTGTTTQTGAFNLAGAASPLQVQGSAGTSGQVLTSAGAGATPTWSTAAGTGTVTSVSVVTANGVSGTVATATTTPAITLTLGAITPSSVTASGVVTGSAFVPSGSSVPSNGMYLSAANTLNWSTATTLAMTLSSAGALTVVNDITAFSDSRLKNNIETIPNALSKVEAVRGVTYTRTDSDDKQKRHTGVIAQEIEAVLPEAVHINADGIRSVAYGNMMGLLIEAVKELSSQNKALLARLEVLEAKE